jgi:2-isopropylmalate synthase
MKKITIFDTSLRDGMQTIGIMLTSEQRFKMGVLLADFGIDVLEAGFPISSKVDFETVKRLAKHFSDGGPIITAFSKVDFKSIDAAWEAVKYAKRKRIHLGLGVSETHLKHKFSKSFDYIANKLMEGIKHCTKFDWEIQFFAEDATRTEYTHLIDIIKIALEAGASIVNIPDTVGVADFASFKQLIQQITDDIKDYHATVGIHTHNDLGLAVANAIAGIQGGAVQVEGSFIGLGERTGNVDLILLGVYLKEKSQDYFTSLKLENSIQLARKLSRITHFAIPPNYPVIGKNVYKTCAGLHQMGICKEITGERPKSFTYLPFDPEFYGGKISIVYNHLSGRNAIAHRLRELFGDINLSEDKIEEAYHQFMDKTVNNPDYGDISQYDFIFHEIIDR